MRGLDIAGQSLAESSFPVAFFINPTGVEPVGAIPTDIVPFWAAMLFANGATTVDILHAGQVIAHVPVTAKLLRDAIASVPDAGYKRFPTINRKRLLSGVDTFDKLMGGKDLVAARALLQLLIREGVENLLLDSYPIQSSLQFTKAAILDLIDNQLGRRPLFADLTGDGKVDCSDLALVKASLGKRSGQSGFNPQADANGDGEVNGRDVALVTIELPSGSHCQ